MQLLTLVFDICDEGLSVFLCVRRLGELVLDRSLLFLGPFPAAAGAQVEPCTHGSSLIERLELAS